MMYSYECFKAEKQSYIDVLVFTTIPPYMHFFYDGFKKPTREWQSEQGITFTFKSMIGDWFIRTAQYHLRGILQI